MTRKQGKIDDARIDRIYRQTCSGIQIGIMDIGRVFKVGYGGIAAGLNDDGLGRLIVEFVQTIRRN